MITVPQFQKAAKDFRAGKMDIQQFTRMVFGESSADGMGAEVKPTTHGDRGTGNVARGQGPIAEEASAGTASPEGVTSIAPVSSRAAGTFPSASSSAAADPQSAGAIPGARLDLDLQRATRCGFPEVIYGPGKTEEDLLQAASSLLSERQDVLITRVEAAIAERLCQRYPNAVHNAVARTLRIAARQDVAPPGSKAGSAQAGARVAVVTAGTGDIPIAEEAAETLRWMGFQPTLIHDCGVAGPHRLVNHLDTLRQCHVVVVVAGMEGALPSVVGGHLACPVIAVPTSVGYGSHFQGLVPLLGMINSCSANVMAVNIDGGFKAGFMAGLILSQKNASVGVR